MTDEELEAYLARSIPEYARDHVEAGNWDERHALELSKKEHEQLLPKGIHTPDNFLRTIIDDDHGGRRVGEIWYALQKDRARPQLFIYWVGVDEPFRGKGFGTEALRLLEGEAQRLGATSIALHVFATNTKAQALYGRLGFRPTNVLMSKDV
jgi:ribosomal protein S18 acetylase RimI-like enzyme